MKIHCQYYSPGHHWLACQPAYALASVGDRPVRRRHSGHARSESGRRARQPVYTANYGASELSLLSGLAGLVDYIPWFGAT